MRTFTQKQKPNLRANSVRTATHECAHSGQSQVIRSILQLQRTIGNQAVLRWPRADREAFGREPGFTASIRAARGLSRIPSNPNPCISRTPEGEGHRRERLWVLANDPGQALVRWPQLSSREQTQLLTRMASRHGARFAESFERSANSLHGPVNVRNYSDYRTVDRRRLESRGWNLIGTTAHGFDFWVHPSGGSLMVSRGEVAARQPSEVPAREDRSVSPGELPTTIDIPDDPTRRYGPVVDMTNRFLGVEADARLYANGTIEVYYDGSDNPITYIPVPGAASFYQAYNEDGESYIVTPIDIYREFPNYLAEELDLTE